MSNPVEQRIERVIHNLLPESALEGKFGPPKTLSEQLAFYHTPGISLAVLNDFGIEWARGFGVCQAGIANTVTPTTLFQAGSISKPIFALAVMRLVEEGRLDLNENVNNYLTSWRVPAIGDWQPRITLRQLLSHTAGLTVHGFRGYQISEPLPTPLQVLEGEPPANSAKVEVNILPGLQFRYSGGGTTIAQQLVVDVLGQPFPEIMRRLVLDPLGMTDSTYEQPLPSTWSARAATAHPSKDIPLNGKHHLYPEMAAAGLWTTATDLAKVGVELAKVLRGEPSTLLSKENVQAMLRPQLVDQQMGEGDYFGLGFYCQGKGDGFNFGHGGWDEGFVALMRIYPQLGKGAVVMLNSNEGYPILEEVMRAIAQAYDWPDVFPAEKPRLTLPQPESYSGEYRTKDGLQFIILQQAGNVFLQFEQQPRLPLFANSELEFITQLLNLKVSFEKDDQSQITALTLNQAGKQIRAERQT